jgi:hypothetical protein
MAETLSASQGVGLDQALGELKAQGLGSVVCSEETVSQLVEQGKVDLKAGRLTYADPATAERVSKALALRFPTAQQDTTGFTLGNLNPDVLRSSPVGLNPDETKAAQAAGLQIIARFSNPIGATDAYVAGTIEQAHTLGASIFLPMGDQVLGRRDSLKTLEDSLRSQGMLYASPEFAKIGGDENVVADAKDLVVRLHSAQTAELDKLTLDDAVDRYSLAGIERNMRILLLRPVSLASARPLTDFNAFVKAVDDEIRHRGGQIGRPHPFEDYSVPKALILALALSIVPVGFWVGATFFQDRRIRIAGCALLVLLAIASLSRHGVQLMALAATLIYPVAAFLLLDRRKLLNPIFEVVLASAISMIGGMCVAGLLNGQAYLVKAQVFEGIKIAIFVPVLIVGVYYFHKLNDTKAALRSPITWGASVLAFLMVALLAFMIARTGNDNPAGVTGIELQMRQLLHEWLPVRPRTKEFLIGHPMLVLGIGMLGLIRRKKVLDPAFGGWTALALMVGAIGQTGVVNTFCHLHTPIDLSFLRVAVGLVLGCIIGGVLWLIARPFFPATKN